MVRFLQRLEIYIKGPYKNYSNDEQIKTFVDNFRYVDESEYKNQPYDAKTHMAEISKKDINIIDGEGLLPDKWPLHAAAARNDVATITKLITLDKMDPNLQSTSGNIFKEPIACAAFCGALDAILALVKLGADPLRPIDYQGQIPWCKSLRNNYLDCMQFLSKYE